MYFKKEESDRIQIMRALCTVLVVCIHMNIQNIVLANGSGNFLFPEWLRTIQYILSECIGRAAVPFFFLCSSMLLYSKKFTFFDNVKKKFHTLFMPYFLCISLHILLFLIAQKLPFMAAYFYNGNNRIKGWDWIQWLDAYVGKMQRRAPFCEHLWFIRDLMILNIFALPIKKIVYRIPIISGVFCALLWITNAAPTFLDKQAIVFWIVGILLVKYKAGFQKVDKIPQWILYVAPAFLAMDMILKANWLHQVVKVLSLVCLLKITKMIYNRRFKTGKGGVFKILSQYSLFIYMFHVIIISTMSKLAVRFIPQISLVQLTEYLTFPLLTVVFCVLAAEICRKICPWLYKTLVGGRK